MRATECCNEYGDGNTRVRFTVSHAWFNNLAARTIPMFTSSEQATPLLKARRTALILLAKTALIAPAFVERGPRVCKLQERIKSKAVCFYDYFNWCRNDIVMKQFNGSFFRDLWRLTLPYWRSSEQRGSAKGLLGLIILLNLLTVYMSYRVTEWYNPFWNALQHYNSKSAFHQLWVFVLLVTPPGGCIGLPQLRRETFWTFRCAIATRSKLLDFSQAIRLA